MVFQRAPGAGYKSQLATAAYEGARVAVGSFVGARPEDTVVFTRNTTDAINLPAATLPPGSEVIVFAAEHHANLLPWRRRRVRCLPVPAGLDEALDRRRGRWQQDRVGRGWWR